VLFGNFIEQGRGQLVFGYYIGAWLMIAAGLVELFLGVNAEQRSLEDIATPLTAQDTEHGSTDGGHPVDLRSRERELVGSGAHHTSDDDPSSMRRYH